MQAPSLLLSLALTAPAGAAGPAPINGRLVGAESGRADFADYVVWIQEGAALPALPAAGVEHRIQQVNKRFSPAAVAIRAGETVLFENADNVFHNVFSLDKRNPFDLGLFKGGKHFAADLKTELQGPASTSRSYATSGKYFVFCNIHPAMVAAIYVFDHGYYAAVDRDGLFRIPSPPPGRYTLIVDGPRLEAVAKIPLTVPASTAGLTIPLSLSPAQVKVRHSRKDGRSYSSTTSGY